MEIYEVRKNLFDLERSHYLVHCVSADYALGAGIAKQFSERYGMRDKLVKECSDTFPNAVLVENVFNLVTKEKYWHKPSYESLEESLVRMREILDRESITRIAMPRIGSGLDKLSWDKVRGIIERVFSSSSIEIVVCYV